MGVTLDSSVLIELLRGDPGLRCRLDELERSGQLPVLSAVVVFEALSGAAQSRPTAERDRLAGLLDRVPIEAFGPEDARRAAEVRGELGRKGRALSAVDCMIAGYALARGHTLVTRDRRLATAGQSVGLNTVAF